MFGSGSLKMLAKFTVDYEYHQGGPSPRHSTFSLALPGICRSQVHSHLIQSLFGVPCQQTRVGSTHASALRFIEIRKYGSWQRKLAAATPYRATPLAYPTPCLLSRIFLAPRAQKIPEKCYLYMCSLYYTLKKHTHIHTWNLNPTYPYPNCKKSGQVGIRTGHATL